MPCAGWTLRSLAFSSKLLLHSRPIHQAITSGFASHNSNKYQNLWSEDFDSIYSLKMPKSKERLDTSSDSSSNSSSEDEKPQKRQKTEKVKAKEDKAESSKKTKAPSSKADEKEPCWDLGNNRQVKVRSFKGKLYVDIREYYEKDGDLLPGKKGISMGVPMFEDFMKIIHEVEDVVKIKAGN